jgi:DNA transposition AAA+ family ATPase
MQLTPPTFSPPAPPMDASFWEEIERSRRLTGAQKMSESLRLFDEASRRMLCGIKAEFPGISDDEARRIRAERLDILRRIESLP